MKNERDQGMSRAVPEEVQRRFSYYCKERPAGYHNDYYLHEREDFRVDPASLLYVERTKTDGVAREYYQIPADGEFSSADVVVSILFLKGANSFLPRSVVWRMGEGGWVLPQGQMRENIRIQFGNLKFWEKEGHRGFSTALSIHSKTLRLEYGQNGEFFRLYYDYGRLGLLPTGFTLKEDDVVSLQSGNLIKKESKEKTHYQATYEKEDNKIVVREESDGKTIGIIDFPIHVGDSKIEEAVYQLFSLPLLNNPFDADSEEDNSWKKADLIKILEEIGIKWKRS